MATAAVFDIEHLGSRANEGPRSILRLLNLLAHLSAAPEGRTLAQLCKTLGLPKTSLHTMLKVLESADYVAQDDGVFRLGKAAATLGAAMARSPGARFPDCAKGILRRLSQRFRETVFLAVLTADGLHCKYVAVQESENWLRYSVKLGSQKPSYATGSGRAMLAYLGEGELAAILDRTKFERITPGTVASRRALLAGLRDVRRAGASVVESGTVAGVVSVAAPIFGADGRVAAALSIGAPSVRIAGGSATDGVSQRRAFESAVRDGAEEISRLLGYEGAWPPA